MISLTECKKRRLYQLDSRNLTFGVFNGRDGFIGIRFKFGSRYLDTEYHWDTGPPFGTVRPVKDMGIDIPPEIALDEGDRNLFFFLEKISEDCADCGKPILGKPIYWMGTSARCEECHKNRMKDNPYER